MASFFAPLTCIPSPSTRYQISALQRWNAGKLGLGKSRLFSWMDNMELTSSVARPRSEYWLRNCTCLPGDSERYKKLSVEELRLEGLQSVLSGLQKLSLSDERRVNEARAERQRVDDVLAVMATQDKEKMEITRDNLGLKKRVRELGADVADSDTRLELMKAELVSKVEEVEILKNRVVMEVKDAEAKGCAACLKEAREEALGMQQIVFQAGYDLGLTVGGVPEVDPRRKTVQAPSSLVGLVQPVSAEAVVLKETGKDEEDEEIMVNEAINVGSQTGGYEVDEAGNTIEEGDVAEVNGQTRGYEVDEAGNTIEEGDVAEVNGQTRGYEVDEAGNTIEEGDVAEVNGQIGGREVVKVGNMIEEGDVTDDGGQVGEHKVIEVGNRIEEGGVANVGKEAGMEEEEECY